MQLRGGFALGDWTIHPMEVNFEQAAARWIEVSDYLEKNFTVVKK